MTAPFQWKTTLRTGSPERWVPDSVATRDRLYAVSVEMGDFVFANLGSDEVTPASHTCHADGTHTFVAYIDAATELDARRVLAAALMRAQQAWIVDQAEQIVAGVFDEP